MDQESIDLCTIGTRVTSDRMEHSNEHPTVESSG
jgi:hypothetical protein